MYFKSSTEKNDGVLPGVWTGYKAKAMADVKNDILANVFWEGFPLSLYIDTIRVLWSVKCNELIVQLANQRAVCQAGIFCYANILIDRTTQAAS